MAKSIRITSIGDDAIEINNTYVPHPVIAFKDSYFLWDVSSRKDVSIDSLLPITTYFPTIEVIIRAKDIISCP